MERITAQPATADPPFPHGVAWDPRRAIVQWDRSGNKEEAAWLAFITTLFSAVDKGDPWVSVRSFYSGFGEGPLTWAVVSAHPAKIDELRNTHSGDFKRLRFGNHRKHEHEVALGAVIASYVRLVKRESGGSQTEMFVGDGRSPRPVFSDLMHTLDRGVHRFGRLGCFDFLCVLGNLGVFDLSPDRLYLEGSTGPLRGARLMFDEADPSHLDRRACLLAGELGVSIQVMEDALCNWQKLIR
jgi:Alpha-glutamyl/putrescinyl thymine pyrophosphorylase clade 3